MKMVREQVDRILSFVAEKIAPVILTVSGAATLFLILGFALKQLLNMMLTVVILVGLAMVGLGLSEWVLGTLAQYGIPWAVQLVVMGLLFLLLAVFTTKLLRRR
jgi:hypothetical protein